MRSHAIRIGAIVACLFAPARADDTPTAPRQDHYQRGMARFDVADYDGAVVEFNAAYESTGAPSLLFNLGQTHRLRGDRERATRCYRRFLVLAPHAPNRADVERILATLESPPPFAAHKPGDSLEMPHVAEPATGRPLVLAGAGAVATGLVALGVGVYLQVSANAISDQLGQLSRSNGAWRAADQSLYDRGQADARGATALFIVGGLLAITGVVVGAVGWRRNAARHIALWPSANGAMLSLHGSL